MAGKTAAPWEIGFPEATDEVKVYPAEGQAIAERISAIFGAHVLTYKVRAASYNAVSGEMAQFNKNGATATLPSAATANQIIGVEGAATEVKVATSGGAVIEGDFIIAQATITLTVRQHVILQSDGTNWNIIAGEPKRAQTYGASARTKAEAEAGVEPSVSRLALVVLNAIVATEIFVGAVPLGGSGATYTQLSFLVPPGIKWKAAQAVGTSTLLL